MSMQLKGFDDLQRQFQDLADKAEALNGTQEVNFEALFTKEFMTDNTQFCSFNDLLDASPFQVNSAEDFKAIPDADFDKYICTVTNFASWEEMLEEATMQYTIRQLGL